MTADLATVARHSGLSESAQAVLLAAGCAPTVPLLAARLGYSVRQIRRALAELVAADLVTVEAKRGNGGGTLIFLKQDIDARLRRMSRLGREGEPAPGAEYNPIPADRLDAVRADRARIWRKRFGRWPAWWEARDE